jgi:hypothetical protein
MIFAKTATPEQKNLFELLILVYSLPIKKYRENNGKVEEFHDFGMRERVCQISKE